MKITLTKSEFINRFLAVRAENFSRAALGELFDWLEESERNSPYGETEFDPIAICCDWTEYATALEAAEAYEFKAKESDDERADKSEQQALEFLTDNTTVLETESGVVVMNY